MLNPVKEKAGGFEKVHLFCLGLRRGAWLSSHDPSTAGVVRDGGARGGGTCFWLDVSPDMGAAAVRGGGRRRRKMCPMLDEEERWEQALLALVLALQEERGGGKDTPGSWLL